MKMLRELKLELDESVNRCGDGNVEMAARGLGV